MSVILAKYKHPKLWKIFHDSIIYVGEDVSNIGQDQRDIWTEG